VDSPVAFAVWYPLYPVAACFVVQSVDTLAREGDCDGAMAGARVRFCVRASFSTGSERHRHVRASQLADEGACVCAALGGPYLHRSCRVHFCLLLALVVQRLVGLRLVPCLMPQSGENR
jgi:hypothetical protein